MFCLFVLSTFTIEGTYFSKKQSSLFANEEARVLEPVDWIELPKAIELKRWQLLADIWRQKRWVNVELGSVATEHKTDLHFLYYLALNWILIWVCEPMYFIYVKQRNKLMRKNKHYLLICRQLNIIKFIATKFLYLLKVSSNVLVWNSTPYRDM